MSAIFSKNYSNVSKAVIKQALGLQKNYIEEKVEEVQVIDIEESGCLSCERYILEHMEERNDFLLSSCSKNCDTCPNKKYTTKSIYKKRYMNEKNRIGYKPRLKLNSIKLLLSYYHLGPDKNGILRNIDLKQLAENLHCNLKTVKSNNDTLKQYGYICFSYIDSNKINLYIPNYSAMYHKASEGGSGYFVLSTELKDALFKIASLNTMRIILRQIMELDDGHSFNASEKTYKELKNMLPAYCKPGIIKNASVKNEVFDVQPKEHSIRFIIKDAYNAKKIKEKEKVFFATELFTYFSKFKVEIIQFNNKTLDHFSSAYSLFEEADTTITHYNPCIFTKNELESAAGLCVHYGAGLVLANMAKIYHTYTLHGDAYYDNFGGLLHSLILKDIEATQDFHDAA